MMKIKIAVLVVYLALFGPVSCDRAGPEPSDEGLILGKWDSAFESAINVDGTASGKPSRSSCRGRPIVEFRDDGTLYFQDFEQITPQLCMPITRFLFEGRWQRLQNEKYRLVLTSTENGPDSIIEPERITFPQEGVMHIQFEGVVENGIDKPYFYFSTFFKEE